VSLQGQLCGIVTVAWSRRVNCSHTCVACLSVYVNIFTDLSCLFFYFYVGYCFSLSEMDLSFLTCNLTPENQLHNDFVSPGLIQVAISCVQHRKKSQSISRQTLPLAPSRTSLVWGWKINLLMPIEKMRRHFTLSTHKSELNNIQQQPEQHQQRQLREISTNCSQKCAANGINV